MDQTPQDPGASQPRPGGRWPLVAGFSLAIAGLVGLIAWGLTQRNRSGLVFAAFACGAVCIGIVWINFMQTRVRRKPDAQDPWPDTRLFQGFVWMMFAVMIGESIFLPRLHLPRPILAMVILGSMAVLLAGVLGFAWWLVPRSPLVKQMRPAPRRYLMRFLPAMLLYGALFEAATWYYLHRHPTGLAAVLAGLVPSIPVLFAIRAMLLLLREETDEYLRARGMEEWTLATVLTLGLCTVWGFLDQFEVVPHLPLWAVFPLWAACLFPAQIIVRKRHA